ncbi:MAG: hypothetical protein NT069_31615 [Planctomycetota bacterium]|nr:hypothetical protein [Planctomycetota bacterium]
MNFVDATGNYPLRLLVRPICQKVFFKARRLVIGNCIFARRQHSGLYQFGAAFEVGKYLAGGGFVPTASRNFDDSFLGAILSRERVSFYDDTVGSILSRRHPSRLEFTLCVAPTGKPQSLAYEKFRVFRKWFGKSLPEYTSHVSLRLPIRCRPENQAKIFCQLVELIPATMSLSTGKLHQALPTNARFSLQCQKCLPAGGDRRAKRLRYRCTVPHDVANATSLTYWQSSMFLR